MKASAALDASPSDVAEAQAGIAECLAEIDRSRERMRQDQVEIDRSQRRTRALLDELKAIVSLQSVANRGC